MLTNLSIAINGIKIKNIASNLTIVPFNSIRDEIEFHNKPYQPKSGDVALFRVSDKNCKTFIPMQDMEGRIVNLYPGDFIISPFACCQSTTHIYGILPKEKLVRGDELNLLSDGGSVGIATYVPSFMNKVTILELIAFLTYKGKVINLKQFAPKITPVVQMKLPPVILIAGTSSEIGKTTLASKIMNLLAKKYNKKVSSIMMSCTGSESDEINHKAAGVAYINSFIQMGYPVTYDIPKDEFLEFTEYQFQHIADTQNRI